MKNIVLAICLFCSIGLFAAHEQTINSLSGQLAFPIVVGADIELTDQWYPFPGGWTSDFAHESANGAVVLRYDDQLRTYTDKKWTLTVTYDVIVTDASGSTTTFSSENLTINYDPREGLRYTDRDKKIYDNCHKLYVDITAIDYDEWTAATGSPTVTNQNYIPAFLDDIYFDLELDIERYYNLDAADPTTIYTNYVSTTNELEVSWDYIQGAESYDLEWLFIDAGDDAYPFDDYDFDWRNATRVNVPSQEYRIPLAFPAGILLMRVRGVGIDWDNYTINNYLTRGDGVWTTTGTTGNTSSYSDARYDIETGLLPEMNWSYSAGFAEDGKRVDGAEFYDGMMRGREGITTVNTDSNVVIGQTFYDYEGRPAAGVLPYAESNAGITFYEADQAYNCSDFDTDAKIESPDAMSSGNGAGQYYSASSTTEDVGVPNAEGYPFSRVVYMNDGTNRPHKSGAAGEDLGMAGDNETQYFYGTPMQSQLDRLFGNEVGYASHYKKNFVIDPNGVVSVSYIDQSGNVIATALAGEAPANLEPIDNPNGNPNSAVSLTEDLRVNNGLTPNGDGSETVVTIPVTEESDYEFVYILNSATYCGEGGLEECYSVCEDCVYDVTIWLTNTVTGDSIDITPMATYNIIKEYATTSESMSFTVTLTPGTYRVVKRTTLNQAHLDEVRQNFIDNQECVESMAIVPVPCAEDCHDACEDHYYIGGLYYDDAGVQCSTSVGLQLIADCKAALCDAPIVDDPCDVKYQAMLRDMSPGGQYFDNRPDQYIYNETTGLQTINSEYSINGWLSVHDHSADMLADINAVWSGTDFTTWTQVRDNWDEDWAEILVPYHPEYCAWNYFCNWSCEYIYFDVIGNDDDTINYTSSMSWDYEMATLYDTDGNFSSTDGDYWNPLDMSQDASSAGVEGDNSTYQPYDANTLHQDPRFAGDCDIVICDTTTDIMATDSLVGYLNHFFQPYDENDNPINVFYSVWYVIEDPDDIHLNTSGVYDNTLSASTIDFFQMLHGDGTTEGLIDATPAAGQVTPYQFFRSVYFFYRTLVIEQGFVGDDGVAECHETYSDNDIPAYDAEGYLVADDVYPSLTPQGFTILYPHSPLIDIYGDGCDNPSQGDVVTLITGLVEDGAENPNEIDVEVPSSVGCSCGMLHDFALARGFLLTDYADISDALDEEFGTTTDASMVEDWMDECAEETPSAEDLVSLSFPEELTCNLDIGIENINEAAQQNCEQENYDLAAYNVYAQFTNELDAATDEYMEAYTAACLQNILGDNEVFTVTYDLHEYYYTLYYYDQAGNLVKTVPPEGVVLITNTVVLTEVTAYRDDFRDDTPTGGVDFTPAEHDMISRYAYNSLQQPINASQNREGQTSTYESGETSFWYDYLGRMVVSQNSKQAAMSPAAYSYTIYDPLGRIEEVGEIHTSSTLTPDRTGSRESDGEYYYFDIVSATALETWLGTGTKNDVTYTYYDEEPTLTNSDAPAAFPDGQENLRNRVAAVVYDDDPGGQHDLYGFSPTGQAGYLSAYFYSYDIHGNVKQVVQETPALKTHNQSIKVTTYEYDLISGNVNAVHYQTGERDEFHHRYEYDADNRLKVAYSSRDGVHWEKESKQFYYQAGGVSRVEIGDKTVQGLDYVFTINGWLKGMNRNTIGDNGEFQARDLGQDGVESASNLNGNVATDGAGFTLHYYQSTADYAPVYAATPDFEADMSGTAYGSGITDQYNGNIAGMTTSMLIDDQSGQEVQGRAFTYDQLYRIKSSLSYHIDATTLYNNDWQSSYSQDNRYRENFTYDWNGNIRTVDRYDGTVSSAVQSDDLTYNYATNSNLLTRIDDAASACTYTDDLDDQGTNNYDYDEIGEMTADVSERITDIEWTPYGKVKAVHKDQANNTNSCTSTEYEDADVEFLYTAGQQRLCKIVKPHEPGGTGISDQDQWIYYWYSYDAGGNLMGVYKQSFRSNGGNDYTVMIDLQEHDVFGSGRTGIRHADDESDYYQDFTATKTGGLFNAHSYTGASSAYSKTHYTRTIGYKQYEIANHLGNVLVTISDKRLLYSAGVSPTEVDWYVPDVQSYTDYYVFGAMQTGRAGGSYRYHFNGKENDDEIKNIEGSSQDYGMRMYDPRVGRFFSADPLMYYYAHYTPYQFAGNMPTKYIDLDGAEPAEDGSHFGQVETINNTAWVWTPVEEKSQEGHWVPAIVKQMHIQAPRQLQSASANQTGSNTSGGGTTSQEFLNMPSKTATITPAKGNTDIQGTVMEVTDRFQEVATDQSSPGNTFLMSYDAIVMLDLHAIAYEQEAARQAESDQIMLEHMQGDYGDIIGTIRFYGQQADDEYRDGPPVLLDGLMSLNPLYDVARGTHDAQQGDYWSAGFRFGGAAIGFGGMGAVSRSSKLFTGNTHVYRIMDNATGEVFKYGISSVPLIGGRSLRMQTQLARLNFGLAGTRYTGSILTMAPTRFGALRTEHYLTTLYKYNNSFRPGFIPYGMKRPLGNIW